MQSFAKRIRVYRGYRFFVPIPYLHLQWTSSGTPFSRKRTGGVTKYAERWGKATTNNKIEKTKIILT